MFFREGPRATERELSAMRGGPGWQPMVENLARTLGYDSRVQRAFEATPEELARIHVPTLMLIGGSSTPRMQRGARTVAGGLPNAEIAEIAGQQHMAMLTAPHLFAAPIQHFLSR